MLDSRNAVERWNDGSSSFFNKIRTKQNAQHSRFTVIRQQLQATVVLALSTANRASLANKQHRLIM